MTDRRSTADDRDMRRSAAGGAASKLDPARVSNDFEALLHRFDPKRDEARGERVAELVLIGADGKGDMAAHCRRVADRSDDGEDFSDIARATRAVYDARAPVRLAVVANDASDLSAKLGHAADGLGHSGPQPYAGAPGIYVGNEAWTGTVAFLFPGQGSHYVGMGADLAMSFSAAHAAWERSAGMVLDGENRLGDVVFPPREASKAERKSQLQRLTQTEWAQPAIGAASTAWLAALTQFGLQPAAVGGHSFGELTALHAAGAFDAETLVRLARRRGERMARVAEERGDGAMAAIAYSAGGIASLLAEWELDLVIANHNSPNQVVVSGAVDGVEAAERRCAEAGIAARRLPVATAFHSPFVGAAAATFRADLEEVQIEPLGLPVFSNLDASVRSSSADDIRDRIARQIASPVRFAEMVEAVYANGVRAFVEVGPGATLSRFVDACLSGRPHCAVSVDHRNASGASAMWHALGHLAAAGVVLRLDPAPEGTPWAQNSR